MPSICRADKGIFSFKGTATPAQSHQSAVDVIGGQSGDTGGTLPLKESHVRQTAIIMIFADGAGDMGNLQNRKANIDSRYS